MKSIKQSILTEDEFSQSATQMRNCFLDKFSNPFHAGEERFAWDYWHVPNQYTLVRTPAYHYFPEKLFDQLEKELTDWGLKNLGCSEISPTWLSYYVEGCEQLFHADNPHGPWAFVFSLTDWANRKFSGGETQILNDQVLDYWNDFDSSKGLEEGTLMRKVPAEFNRLTVFDPRIPHGVTPVHGVKDPREARLVVHGWFLEPSPVVAGGLEGQDLDNSLAEPLGKVLDDVEAAGQYNGYVCFRLNINKDGSVTAVKSLVNTLKAIDKTSESTVQVESKILSSLEAVSFQASESQSELTLPLVFK